MHVELYLPLDPRALKQARDALRSRFGSMRTAELDDLVLLVSELVANCVLHSGADLRTSIVVDVEWDGSMLRAEVIDQGDGFGEAAIHEAGTGGMGLRIVDRRSNRWGVRRNGGTHVWFEVGTP